MPSYTCTIYCTIYFFEIYKQKRLSLIKLQNYDVIRLVITKIPQYTISSFLTLIVFKKLLVHVSIIKLMQQILFCNPFFR